VIEYRLGMGLVSFAGVLSMNNKQSKKMKTTQSCLPNIRRYGVCAVAALGLSLNSATALTSVSIPLGGKVIGNGMSINVNSGKKRLDRATAYTYKFVGTVSCTDPSTSLMAFLVPEPIGLKKLLNSFSPGSGYFLSKNLNKPLLNPSGDFPINVIKKAYNKDVPTEFGFASISMNFKAGVRSGESHPGRDGQAYLSLTNVNIIPPPIIPIPSGTLKFDPGAKLVITVVP
jgi:hypothetical protein